MNKNEAILLAIEYMSKYVEDLDGKAEHIFKNYDFDDYPEFAEMYENFVCDADKLKTAIKTLKEMKGESGNVYKGN